MIFWISITIVTVMVLALVFLPVWRLGGKSGSESTGDVAFYKSRLQEIDSDVELGRMDESAAEGARAEEARKLLRANRDTATSPQRAAILPRSLLVASALFVPVFSLTVYLLVGSPQVRQTGEQSTANVDLSGQSLENLLAAAEKRLQEDPDDAQGWTVVAPVYVRLNQYEKGVFAYENALRLRGRNPTLIVGLAEAIVLSNEGQITEKSKTLFAEALRLQPLNVTALFYTGMAAYREENWQAARDAWQVMIQNATGNEDWYGVVSARVQELNTRLEGQPPVQSGGDDLMQGMSQDERREFIEGMVASLAERLQDEPEDREGWLRLVRSYMVLGDRQKAVAAVEDAKAVFGDEPDYIRQLNELAGIGSETDEVKQ